MEHETLDEDEVYAAAHIPHETTDGPVTDRTVRLASTEGGGS